MSQPLLHSLLSMCAITGDVILLDGPHGIGKSEKIASWARENGYFCKPLFASTQEVGDLVGIPHMVDGKTVWAMPSWLAEIIDNAAKGIKSILFLDEFNRAQTDVLNACLELCLNKTMHTHKLPEGTLVVAAINPPNGRYRTQDLDPALMNRFLHVKVEANATEWLEWAPKNGVHRAMISFISKNENKLFYEDDISAQSATPRSWVMASKDLLAIEPLNPSNEALRTLFVGKLGTAVGGQFYNFYKEFSKIVEPEQVIDFVKKQKIDMSNYQNTIETIAKGIDDKLLDGVEHVLLIDLANKLAERYYKVGVTAESIKSLEDKKTVLPLAAFMYAVPLEVAASIMKQLKDSSETRPMYDIIVNSDVEKTLIKKIVNIKIAHENNVSSN